MLSGIKDLFRTYDARISERYQLSIDKFSRSYAKDSASCIILGEGGHGQHDDELTLWTELSSPRGAPTPSEKKNRRQAEPVVKSKRAKTELAEGLIILGTEIRAGMVEALGGLQSTVPLQSTQDQISASLQQQAQDRIAEKEEREKATAAQTLINAQLVQVLQQIQKK
jgi:hypothetical protein